MDLSEFNNHFLPILFEKLSYENKTAVLLGEFNANLLNYDIDTDISDFLDCMHCNSLLPHITSPTRITARSKTLTDNIFPNCFDPFFKSGSLLTTMSDHNAQFLFLNLILIKLKQTKTQKGNTIEISMQWKNKKIKLINNSKTQIGQPN